MDRGTRRSSASCGHDVQRSVRILNAYRYKGTIALEWEHGPMDGIEGTKWLMKEVLAVMGVPTRAMLLENNSRNTNDNALYTAVVLNNRQIQRILLVTSAFHMRRAVPLFERQGFEVIPAPTDYQRLVGSPVLPGWLPSVGNLDRTTLAIR